MDGTTSWSRIGKDAVLLSAPVVATRPRLQAHGHRRRLPGRTSHSYRPRATPDACGTLCPMFCRREQLLEHARHGTPSPIRCPVSSLAFSRPHPGDAEGENPESMCSGMHRCPIQVAHPSRRTDSSTTRQPPKRTELIAVDREMTGGGFNKPALGERVLLCGEQQCDTPDELGGTGRYPRPTC